MITYDHFEAAVLQLLSGDDRWLHVLPSVPEQHRERFIRVLESGIEVPLAFDLVLITREMDDTAFEARWRSLKPGIKK